MSVTLIVLGGIALVLPGLRPSFVLRGNPAWFAVLHALSLLLGLVALLVGLGVSAAVGVIALVVGAPAARLGDHLAPGGVIVDAAAALALLVLGSRALVVARRTRRLRRAARAEAWLGEHRREADHVLVVVPTAEAVAYCVPGPPPQVVLSQGVLDHLDGPLVAFVIGHERAHLRRKHHRLLQVATVADALLGALPPVARSAAMVRLAVERAADEDAAGVTLHERRRGALALRRLAAIQRTADPAVARYRARQLLVAPKRPLSFALAAATALGVLAATVVGVAGHAGADLPGLLALLR